MFLREVLFVLTQRGFLILPFFLKEIPNRVANAEIFLIDGGSSNVNRAWVRFMQMSEGFYSLESYIFDQSNNGEIYFFSKEGDRYDFCKNISSKPSKNPSKKYVTGIVYSCNNSWNGRDESDHDRYDNDARISRKCDQSSHKSTTKERMSWWERVIERVWNQRSNAVYYFLGTHSPFSDSKIDDRIDRKGEYNRRKDHKSSDFVSIIVFLEPIEPQSNEKSSWPYHYRLSKYLNNSRIIRSNKSTRPDEKFSVESEEGF